MNVLLLDAVAFVRGIATLPSISSADAWSTLQNIRRQAVELDAKLKPVLESIAESSSTAAGVGAAHDQPKPLAPTAEGSRHE